jgi:O-antigen/teichoic acid export membrane protein
VTGTPRRLSLSQAAGVGLGADLALIVAALAAVPYLVGRLGAEPYGILGIISILGGQLGVFHLGVGAAGSRVVAEAAGAGDDRALSRRVWGVWAVALGAMLLVAAAFLVAGPVAWRRGFAVSPDLMDLALASVVPGALLVALTPAAAAAHGVLRGRERFAVSAVLRTIQGVGRLGGAVVVVAMDGGVLGVLWVQAAVDGLLVTVAAVMATPGLPRGGLGGVDLRPVLRIGVPLALAGLFTPLLLDAEKLVVGIDLSVESFTYYSVPFNAVIRLLALAGAVEAVLTPRMAALTAGGAEADVARLAGSVTRAMALVLSSSAVLLAALAPELLDLWLGADFAQRSTLPVRIVLVGLTINAVAIPAHSVILSRMPTTTLVAVYAAELAVHIPVTFFAVGRWGLAGAALAWGFRAFLDTLVQRHLAARNLGGRVGSAAWAFGPPLLLGLFVVASASMSLPLRVTGAVALAALGAVLLLTGREGKLVRSSLLRRTSA